MACEIESIGNDKLYNRLMKLTNNDKLRSLQYLTTIMNPDFRMWYVSTTQKEVDLSNMNKISPTFVKAVKQYINLTEFNISNSVQDYNTARTTIFGNDLAKEDHAINTLVTFMLKGENALRNAGKKVDKNLLKQTLLKQLYTHVQKNKDNLTDEQREYCNILYAGIKNSDDLYNIVIRHPKVNELSRTLGLFKVNENLLQDDNSDAEVIDVLDDEGIAGLREDWSDLGDQRKDYDKNISKEVKQLFALTGETISTERIDGNPNYNSATYSGIPETIEFLDYYKTILTNATFDDAQSFVQSLYELADRFPNRSSLSIVADKISGNDINSINLRNKVYTQFNQARVQRNELLYSSGQISPRIRNRGSFPQLVMYDKVIIAFNNLTFVPVGVSENANKLDALTNKIKEISSISDANERNLQYNEVRDNLINLYNSFNIGVTEEGINNYIKFNGTGNIAINLNNLIRLANSFNKTLIDTYPKVIENNNTSKEWYREEYKKAMAAEEIGENYIIQPVPADKLNDISRAGNKIANAIAETFANYQTVNLEFNSINVENNLVSDIIKPSMLKRFFDRLGNEQATLEYFTNKANLSQYNNSNIIVEVTDSKGNIIVPGILKRNADRTYTLTDYYKFLDYQLFNGARNEVLNTNKTYSKMTRTEWDITALNEFVNNNDIDPNGRFKLSRYFMQTPSDAPKNFSITSYRLSIDGLYGNKINRNHPIYKALFNIVQQEYNDAAQALTFLFETDEVDGNITLRREGNRKLGELAKPILKEEFRVSDLSNTSAELNYHRRGNKIIDKNKLVGNVFNINKLNLNDNADAETNVNELVDGEGNKISDFLYGGDGNGSLNIRRDTQGKVIAVLTDSQREAIENYLDNYLIQRRRNAEVYFANYINNVEGFNNVKTEGLTKEQQAEQATKVRERYNDFVTEFSLNYTIQYNNFNDLFAGSPKFYKNNQDTIKRNKEVQAGGLIYAGYELNNTEDKNLGEVKIGDKTIKITSSFKYISLNDIDKPSNNLESIEKQLKEANVPQSVYDFIMGQFGGKTTTSDAQSYITLDEFVRRAVLSGEYDNYKDTIEALYDESRPIDFDKLSKLIQVQKNFYYGLDVDNNTGLEVPNQIKNAEYVLIPRFLGNTELALLNKKMLDKGIAQANFISTEKATTNKILTFWNNEGNLTQEDIVKFDEQLTGSIKTGWYSNLYKQQDVPQHMDEENKAGIQIIKKMLDNINSTELGQLYIDQFFNNYNANIIDSFNQLAERLGVKYSNGDIVYEDGSPVLDMTEFYNLIRDELTSRGADTNIMSYATIKDGLPLMPTYINNVRSKLESVVQSIFTNNITRQTIPGFHASQVSTTGMRKLDFDAGLTQSEFESKHGYNLGRKLEYHPNGDNYMEIMIPRHMMRTYNKYDADGNLIYEFTIDDLRSAGLDYMIGYRIPTEGKQSVVRMKVVGFLNEAQGSTIIVPDEFVTQTGSDFDIDSVYAMYHNVWFDKDGKPHKVEYKDDTNSDVKERYLEYIRRKLPRRGADILQESRLDKDERTELRNQVRDKLIKDYGFVYDLNNEFSIAVEEAQRTNFEEGLLYAAKKLNLMSEEEFSELPIELQNSREARNNQIVDAFLGIMQMKEAWEENLMSSNFEDIKAAKREIFGAQDRYRNINTFEAQSMYRDEVMAGAQLKAISVKRDGFCSISNLSKTTIMASDGFKFVYDTPVSESTENFAERLRKTYGIANVEVRDNKVAVNHKYIGWSRDNNRNLTGKLITVYSSETTALILDGVKEGGVPNVNLYTFDVYKSIVDAGSDYKTAILFINQPAVTACIEVNNNNENIFEVNNNNEINTVRLQLYRALAEANGINLKPFESIRNITNRLKERGIYIPIGVDYFDVSELQAHMNDNLRGGKESEILYQIKVLNAFQHFKAIANQINVHSNILNTDKVGAGQSVNETDKLVKDILQVKYNNDNMREEAPKLTSSVNGEFLVDAIYPRVLFEDLNELRNDISESVYPSLYYQLKYGVIASSAITSNLFLTHSSAFKLLKNNYLNSKDLATVKEFENYIITKAMNQATTVRTNTYKTKNSNDLFNNYNIDISEASEYENRRRIFGYNRSYLVDFDFNDKSEENVAKFMSLTPANKVLLLQTATTDDNLFKRLIVNIKDDRLSAKGRHSKQTINIVDSGVSYEQMYQLFKNAYYNDNPFIQTAAIDLVRYAIVVEGYKFSGGSISKIIPTEILYQDLEQYNSIDGVSSGLGIIYDTNRALDNFLQSEVDVYSESIDNLITSFYRSYTKSKDIVKFENKRTSNRAALSFKFNGMAIINKEEASKYKLVESVSSSTGEVTYVKFLMTNPSTAKGKRKELNLYRVIPAGDNLYIYPLNKLEPNEIGTVSVNPDNLTIPAPSVYESIIRANENIMPDNPIVINNLPALEKARYNITRDIVAVRNLNESVDALSPVEDMRNRKLIDIWLDTYTNANIIRGNTIIDTDNFDTSKRTVMVVDDVQSTITNINNLEDISYSNYMIIAQNSEAGQLRGIIGSLNRAELERIKTEDAQRKLEVRRANLTTKYDGKETGSYGRLKELVKQYSLRVINNGLNFISVENDLVRRLNFNPNTYHQINIDGVNYVLTYLGEVSKNNIKLLSDYNKPDNKDLLDEIVAKATLLSPYSRANLIKIETYEHFKNDVRESVLIDNDEAINQYISEAVASVERTERNVNDDAVTEVARAFTNLDIRVSNSEKFNDIVREAALRVINGYTSKRSEYFLDNINDFYSIGDKHYSINNPELFDLMLNDDSLRTGYENFIDSINRFIEDYSSVAAIEPYDITKAERQGATPEEIAGLRRSNEVLKQLKDQFAKINSLDNQIKTSIKLYFNKVISSLSSDPRIKSQLIELTEAFDDENWSQLKLADSQETHIPIVQVVLKEAMVRLRQSEIDARDRRITFRDAINKIIEDAKKNNVDISLNDILDEDGNLILPYTKNLVDEIVRLREEVKLAGITDPDGRNGIEYKKAKDAQEEFLIDNVERQYKKVFYEDYNRLNHILDKYPQTYVRLKKLMQEQADILSTMIDGDYNTILPENAKRLNEIRSEIAEMRSEIDVYGEYKENYREARAINQYYLTRRGLDAKYKEVIEKPEFRRRFDRAMSDLKYPETSETYREAKEWLDANTYQSLTSDFRKKLSEAYKKTRLGNPIDGYMISMFRGKYDREGIIDGTKFNEQQVANIKKNEEQRYLNAAKRKKLDEDAAEKWLDENVEWVNTKYYESKYVEMNSQGKEVFEKWYKDNHVVNQLTGQYEPLLIWKTQKIKDPNAYEYSPRSKWLQTKVKEEWNNPKYKPDRLQASSKTYINNKYYNMNKYQVQLYEEVNGLLNELVRDKRNRAYINKGYLPNQAISDVNRNKTFKDYWNDFAASHGWYDTPMKSELELNFNKREVNAPMLHSLSKIELIPLRRQGEGESNEDYAEYVRKTNAENRELIRQREKENKELNNPNLGERLDTFIGAMYTYNTTNDVARLMKLTSAQLRNMEFVSRNSKGIPIKDRIMERITGNEQVRTKISGEDSNVVKHFESQMRKLIFNEFEYDQGVASKISRVARNAVSLKFMTLNLTGGIANILYGKAQIQMEEAAGDNFKYKDFRRAENEYMQGMLSFIANVYNEKTDNITDGIFKLFNVIESNMVTERYGDGESPIAKFENLLYVQQSSGEHYMQNTALLAMMYSHRVTEINGKPEVMSFTTYKQDLRGNILRKVLADTDTKLLERYDKTMNRIFSSLKDKEQYVRFKRDAITDFLRSVDNDVRKKFIDEYKEAEKNAQVTFENLPTFRDQFELVDGYARLRKDSPLSNRDVAEFREKAIKVNHHIHGIYDKIGANTLQQTWWGSLAMQFHKHLVPGFQKRFGYRLGHTDGIYNETRETVNKGTYVSLVDFLRMPLSKYYELDNSGELTAVKALQNIVKGYADFISNFNVYYNILPDYDKANLRRVLAEWVAIAKALALFTVGKLMLDDDDESTQAADYILYSADRLMSESIQYTPWGMVNEGSKLYKQPVAAFSLVQDASNIISAVTSYVITGEVEDLYYQSGTKSGQNKVTTSLVKFVPIWNQLQKHENLGNNNQYYKLRSNPFSGISSLIGDIIEENE